MSLQIMTEDGAKIVAGNVGGGSLPTPTDENKMLISNSSLEWVEIDKADVGISDEYKSKIDSAVQSVKIGNTEYKVGTNVVLPNYPTTLPASDVKAWAKADEKPTYTAEEVGALPDTTVIPTVSNIYSATSEDAMSGLAVASAISDINEMPTPTANNKVLVSNSDLEWVEKSTTGLVTAKTSTNHTDSSTRQDLLTKSFASYWDGSYSETTHSSNLTYCNQGAFGDIVTYNIDDIIPKVFSITSGTCTANTSTTFTVNFNKTYSKVPKVVATVYANTSYNERVIRINTTPTVTTSSATITIYNPHTADQALSSNRRIEIMVFPQI